jgi:hypothetical protein
LSNALSEVIRHRRIYRRQIPAMTWDEKGGTCGMHSRSRSFEPEKVGPIGSDIGILDKLYIIPFRIQ